MHVRALGLIVIAMAGCDSEAPPPAPSPAVTASAASGTVPCSDVIGTVPTPDPGLTVIDDAVALPAAAGMPAPLQVSADRTETGSVLFAKTGLLVRRRAQVRLRVLPPAAGRAWIGWGSPAEPGPQALVDGCDSADAWMAFAGGYWVRTPMCVPVGVRVGRGVEHQVDIGVGKPCPSS